jgi:hypothetical protein
VSVVHLSGIRQMWSDDNNDDKFPGEKKSGSTSEWHSKVNSPGISMVEVHGK